MDPCKGDRIKIMHLDQNQVFYSQEAVRQDNVFEFKVSNKKIKQLIQRLLHHKLIKPYDKWENRVDAVTLNLSTDFPDLFYHRHDEYVHQTGQHPTHVVLGHDIMKLLKMANWWDFNTRPDGTTHFRGMELHFTHQINGFVFFN